MYSMFFLVFLGTIMYFLYYFLLFMSSIFIHSSFRLSALSLSLSLSSPPSLSVCLSFKCISIFTNFFEFLSANSSIFSLFPYPSILFPLSFFFCIFVSSCITLFLSFITIPCPVTFILPFSAFLYPQIPQPIVLRLYPTNTEPSRSISAC